MKSYSKLVSFIQYLVISILVTSCGGGGGGATPLQASGSTTNEVLDSIVISGTVAKGIVKNGIVILYAIENGVQGSNAFLETQTDLEGNFEFELTEDLFDLDTLEANPLKVLVIAGPNTTMTCDVLMGCGLVVFGDDIPIDDNGPSLQLQAILPVISKDSPMTANVSALTTMAGRSLELNGTSLTRENVQIANDLVAELFQLEGNLTELGVVDITDSAAFEAASLDVQLGSLISAAILTEGLDLGYDIKTSVNAFADSYTFNNNQVLMNELTDTSITTMEEVYNEVLSFTSFFSLDGLALDSLVTEVTNELSIISSVPSDTYSSFLLAFRAAEYIPSSVFASACFLPRVGIDPTTGFSYTDTQGSLLLENQWLRSWTNELYLWYDEVSYANPENFISDVNGPLTYFDTLKTLAVTPSGAPRDQFHFAIDSDVWNQLNQSGVTASYGATFYIGESPQSIIVSYVEPGYPAALAGFVRGTEIFEIGSLPVSSTDINTLAIALFPATVGESYSFIVSHPGSINNVPIVLTSDNVTSTPVLNTSVINTGTGDVGYILFNEHIATSEQQLFDAFTTLDNAAVNDLVLDLRYNGGGLLAIAAQTAYMIAGSDATDGKIFETLSFNDKYPVNDPFTGQAIEPFPFFNQGLGFSLSFGQALPSLDLDRVFILSSPGTCSASESIINSLRGINVEVILVGAKTCGKPYGFIPEDNCGTTYFSIQFSGENQLSFGDYSDGFSPQNWFNPNEGVLIPGCTVGDDFNKPLGDPSEAMLAAALQYRSSNTCPAASVLSTSSSPPVFSSNFDVFSRQAMSPYQQQSLMRQNRILSMPR